MLKIIGSKMVSHNPVKKAMNSIKVYENKP
jgi:hypothetical protein